MPLRFSRSHAQTKKMIASCAAQGVGIDGLADAPSFRLTPAQRPDARPTTSFSNGEESGKPSARGSIACGKRKPKHLKTWNPSRLCLDPMYQVPMAGDGWKLDRARKAYHNNNPEPLREYLAKLAADRRAAAEPIQLALAA